MSYNHPSHGEPDSLASSQPVSEGNTSYTASEATEIVNAENNALGGIIRVVHNGKEILICDKSAHHALIITQRRLRPRPNKFNFMMEGDVCWWGKVVSDNFPWSRW